MTITIPVKFEADGSDLNKEINQTVGAGSKAGKALRSAAVPAAAALAGLTATALKFANAAADDAKAQSLLALALKQSGGATKEQLAFAEEFISKMSEAAAVSDDELRPALANLVRGTGDVKIAQRALVTALDVSAATGKPLATVSAAISKAYAGNTSALGRLIPNLNKAALESKNMDVIMGELAQTTGGAAAEAANSTAGQMKGMQIAMDEAQETIGTALLPAMSFLATTLASVATFVQENSTVVLILGGVMAGLAVTVLAVNAAMSAYAAITTVVTAAQKAFNFVLAANPIFLVVGLLAALAVGLVIAYKKSQTFRDIVNGAFNAVWNAVKAVFNWIKSNWPLLVGILFGPVGIGVALVIKNFDKIKTFVQNLPSIMLQAGKDMMSSLLEGIKNGASAVGGFVASIATALKDAINDLLNLPLEVGPLKVFGKTVVPEITLIPKFAGGTDFAPGGLSLVGEEGPELVNLPRGSKVNTARETRDILGGAGNVTVVQNFNGPNTSAGRLRELEWTLRFATGRMPRQAVTAA